jgi:hypothetical protein
LRACAAPRRAAQAHTHMFIFRHEHAKQQRQRLVRLHLATMVAFFLE